MPLHAVDMGESVLVSVAKYALAVVTKRALNIALELLLSLTPDAIPAAFRYALDQFAPIAALMRGLITAITQHYLVFLLIPVGQANVATISLILEVGMIKQRTADRFARVKSQLFYLLLTQDLSNTAPIFVY